MPNKHSVTAVRLSILGLAISFLLYFTAQIPFFTELRNPDGLFGPIWFLGLGICLFTYSVSYTYYVWTLDEISFMEWEHQIFPIRKKSNAPSTLNILSTRLMTPLMALISLIMVAAGILFIYRVFFL